MTFEHLPPRYVYDDRFTAVWSPYDGMGFQSYRVYVRPSAADIATWVPSGSTYLYAEIVDENAHSQIVSDRTKQTEYDVCVVVLTDGGYVYSPRQTPAMRGVPSHAVIGGARHVNTTDTNEDAAFMDGDILAGTPAFSTFSGRIMLTMLTNDTERGSILQELLPDGRFSTPTLMPIGHDFGCAVQNGSNLWAWTAHAALNPERSRIWSMVTRSTDGGQNWTERTFISDICPELDGYELVGGAGEPIALSDGSDVLPLYISPICSSLIDGQWVSINRTISMVLLRTTDGGQSFSRQGWISQYPAPCGYRFHGEPCVEKLGGSYPNEHLVCSFRGAGSGTVGFVQSLNSGITWETIVENSTLGTELATSNNAFGNSLPRIKYVNGYLYVLVGNRVNLGIAPDYAGYDSVNNAAYLFRKQVEYTGSLVPSIGTGWSVGLKLGGSSASTHNFDANGYGTMYSAGDGVMHCCYLACVGQSRELGYGGMSFPYIAHKAVDLATFTVIAPTKYIYSDLELVAIPNIDRVSLSWPNIGGYGVTIEREVVE